MGQSVKDFGNPAYREESINFFRGEGFKIYSEIARLNCIKQSKAFQFGTVKSFMKKWES
jgi:hypothetical protein